MIIPPNDGNTKKYFKVSELNSDLGLEHLSMGMSEDYELAIKFNSTFLKLDQQFWDQELSMNNYLVFTNHT